jgi:hypoxanthine-guanine phosphoribosyltransferase
MCGKDVDNCICPECPVCEAIGDPLCYEKHGLIQTEEQKESLAKYEQFMKEQEEIGHRIENAIWKDHMDERVIKMAQDCWNEIEAETLATCCELEQGEVIRIVFYTDLLENKRSDPHFDFEALEYYKSLSQEDKQSLEKLSIPHAYYCG